MQRDIKQQWFLEHHPEVVWEFLTNSDLLGQWLMPNDFKPVAGHEFRFQVKPKVKIGFDGIVYCKVLEVIPCKKLSYSWKGGPGHGKITLDSVVTWTLTPINNGTELILHHTGFHGFKNLFAYMAMNSGWGTKIKTRLINLVNKENEKAHV